MAKTTTTTTDAKGPKLPPVAVAKTKRPVAKSSFSKFLTDDQLPELVPDEAVEITHRRALIRRVQRQSIVIIILVAILVLGAPLMQPVYQFHAINPEKQLMDLVPLTMPNMTNQAVLSWVTTSITEIMTLGFGDFDRQILSQRGRFTESGWQSFILALDRQKLRDDFKQRQLVRTASPQEVAVIIEQGVNPDGVYQWKVELPVVMTDTTNNGKQQIRKPIIQLTIVRVPTTENQGGIAIKSWTLNGG